MFRNSWCVKSSHPFYTSSTIHEFIIHFSYRLFIFPSYILSTFKSNEASSNTLSLKGKKSFIILSITVFWGAYGRNGRRADLDQRIGQKCSNIRHHTNIVDRKRSTRKRRDHLNPNFLRHYSFRLFTSSVWVFSCCFNDRVEINWTFASFLIVPFFIVSNVSY